MIQQRIANPLASWMLREPLKPGTLIVVDWDGREFKFTAEESASQPPAGAKSTEPVDSKPAEPVGAS